MDDRIIRNMRSMAWERAKGELNSMLHTYWDDKDRFQKILNAIDKFVELIENEGWCE